MTNAMRNRPANSFSARALKMTLKSFKSESRSLGTAQLPWRHGPHRKMRSMPSIEALDEEDEVDEDDETTTSTSMSFSWCPSTK